jgi:acetolactate decarboxylase
VGALEGLAGEVTIYQGKTWISKDDPKAVEATDESATLLFAAHVTDWNEMHNESAIEADQLERVIRNAARQSGLDSGKPFPFVIEGRLTVEAHVIRGACPHGGASSDPPPPITFSLKDEPGTLVGIFAENSEGILTHHGTKIHAHVLTKEQPHRSGHVDSASVAASSILRLPKGRSP